MALTPPAARTPRRLLTSLLLASIVVGAAGAARAQVVNEPPVLPVVIAVLPSADAIEASGFTDGVPVDISLIRNGVTISLIPGATSVGGVLNVNVAGGPACWAGVTPDIRAGDIVRFAQQGGPTDQVHVMPVTIGRPVQIPGGIELHGTASDFNGAPIPVANIEQRMISKTTFAFNGKRTLRAGGASVDGTLTYDTVNNPTGTNFTVRYTGLSAGDISLAMAAQTRMLWLGTIPANANELTIYENDPAIVPGPLAGTCTAPLEPLDVTAPTAPGSLASTVTGPDSRNFTWTGSTDNVQVAGYELRRDGVAVARVGPLATSAGDTGIPVGAHAYTVVAFDNASPRGAGATPADQIIAGYGQLWGNRSAASNTVNITQADVVAPTTPAGVTVATGNGKAIPSWSPATDNVGVVSYGVYRNNVLIATVASPTTTYKDSGLVTGTYNYSIDAVDAANLRSTRSANVPANVVFIPDTTPPTVPGGVSASVTPDIHGRNAVINWNAATDNLGVTGYTLYRDGVQRAVLGPATFTFTDNALTTATHVYKVDAFDAANNHSAQSVAGTAVIANDPPLAPHTLSAQFSRDALTASGYPAAQGPYTFTVFRGATTFTSAPANADAGGVVQVNLPGGACWLGTTPDLRPGDVVRITNAAGIAEQSTIANLVTEFAVPVGGGTVVVHGIALDAAGSPLPLSQIENHLVAASGVFDKNSTTLLRANSAGGVDGTLSYDSPGSTHWTATYAGLSALDVERAVGSSTVLAAQSQGVWLGRTPGTNAELSFAEAGFQVSGGPGSGCAAPLEAPAAGATFFPTSVGFPDVSAIPAAASTAKTIEIQNTGNASMTVYAVYVSGLHAADYAITSPAPPASLAPGAFFTVDIVFSPQALGNRQARLCLACDAAGTTALMVPLSGNGITDTTPPTIPSGVSATNPDPRGHEAFVTWTASTDSVGVTGYTVYRDGSSVGTTSAATLAFHDTGLAAGPHSYRVDAFDLQSNHSAQSVAARVIVAHEPPVAGHLLTAHPSRDQVTAAGYAAPNGPFVVDVFRGAKHFVTGAANADGSGQLSVNTAAGICWSGTTPDLRVGDIVRITDANGNADQTTIANIAADPAAAVDSASVEVHGTAEDAAGHPLPLAQIDHLLVSASGPFDKSGTTTLHADAIVFDSPGSKHWTATYTGLSAADVMRATGSHDGPGSPMAAAESQGLWLGGGTERTVFESGPGVSGGPFSPSCNAAPETPSGWAAFIPAMIQFGRQGEGSDSDAQSVLFQNAGDIALNVSDVCITGLNAKDFEILSELPAVIAPHSAVAVKVAFKPEALGQRQAALTLVSDAANQPAVSAPLAGTGWSGLVIKSPGGPAANLTVGSQISPAGGTRTVPVVVSWGASASPEADHYDLQQSVNGSAFVDAPVQPGAATQVTLALPLAQAGAPAAWRFRVRAGGAGETSEWVNGGEFGLEPVDDTNLARCNVSGSWTTDVQADAWGGSERKSLSVASIELKSGAEFTALGSIAWLTTMGPDRGLASVKVDDKDSVIVDLTSPVVKIGAVGFVATNLAAGRTHKLVVHAIGKRGTLSTGFRVDADGFIVLDGAARATVVAINHRGPGGNLTANESPEAPAALSFSRIAPNPSLGRAVLTFALPRDGAVQLDIVDVQGRRVARVTDGVLPAGEQHVAWDGRTSGASAARSGVYFAVLRYEGQTLVRRMILMP